MKRFLAAILCIGTAFSLLVSAGTYPHADEADGGHLVRAYAEEGEAETGDAEAEPSDVDGGQTQADWLILPSSYEQYLPLNAPSDISLTGEYTAIADGNILYIYDRGAGQYRRYEHTQNVEAENNVIEEVQFAEDGTLYFRDVSLFLYRMEISDGELTAEKTDLACNSFEIWSDTVYFTTTSQILRTTLDNLDSTAGIPIISNISSRPALALDNGVLYYTEGGKILCKADDPGFSKPLTQNETVTSLAVYEGRFYYTDTSQTMYVYDLIGENTIASYAGGYTSLAVWDGYIYAVDANRVRRYSPAQSAFTDYEIGASSSSPNRLSGAKSLFYTDGFLMTADSGNGRISVYDEKTGSVKTIAASREVCLAASDGKTVAAISPSALSLYDLSAPDAPLYTFSDFQGEVVGATCVYGVYYLVTAENRFYRLAREGEGWTMDGCAKSAVSYPARLLASDIYGDLYAAFSDGSVYRFSESEFTDPADVGEKVCTVPVLAAQIAVDYAQTVYALSGNRLYACAADGQTIYPLGKSAVWSQTEDTQAVSFAFGVEEGGVYLLYEGDFILRTSDIPLPTLRTIPADDADEPLFGDAPAEFSVVETAENALFVRFDLASFQGAEYFPYLGYFRESETRTALKLGEAGAYDILALYDGGTRSYASVLVLRRYCTPLPEDDYLQTAEGFEGGKGYLTNAVSLYKYPYLTSLLTLGTLSKNAEVTVLGRVDTPDGGYYRVSLTDENGALRTGFVPAAYVTPFDGAPVPPQPDRYGGEGADTDSVWRLAFLLLGCASICVLVDFLIIKRKDK